MKGSGFENIVIEATVCASGSLQKVMSRKHYNRTLRVYKMMLEAMKSLLFEAFTAHDLFVWEMDLETTNAVKKLTEKPDSERFHSLIISEKVKGLFNMYSEFKNGFRNGSLGKTAQFWIGYMDIM